MDKSDPKFEELKKLMEEKDSLAKEGKYLEAEEIRKKIIRPFRGRRLGRCQSS